VLPGSLLAKVFSQQRRRFMPESARILFINNSDISGGAGRAAFRVFEALQSGDISVKMLVKEKYSNNPDVISVNAFAKSGISLKIDRFIWKIKNRIRKQKWKKYPNREKIFLNDLNSIPLSRVFESIYFDILHLHFVANEFLNLKELKRIKKPIVWTLHDCWPFTGICHYFYNCDRFKKACGECPMLHSSDPKDFTNTILNTKRNIYKHCDLHIVCPSNWLAVAARSSNLFKNFPVSVIPNGIDTQIFKPMNKQEARQFLHLKDNKSYVLFGAVNAILDSRKGFQLLLESLKYISVSNDQSIEFLIFGTNKDDSLPFSGFPVHNMGIIENDEELAYLFSAADVVVVPSIGENLSNVIMESLSCGTPVIAFDIGGNSDMIEHKKNGYLADPFYPEDLASGIGWCLNNNRNNELSENARKKVLENFSIEFIQKSYAKLYHEISKNE